MRVNGFMLAAATAVVLGACASKDSVRLDGRFAGHAGNMVFLEQVLPADQRMVDSAKLDKKGNFDFTLKTPENRTTLYNLHYNNDVIPLFLSPGDKVAVNSVGDISYNYTVEGSEESSRLRDLKKLLGEGTIALDSLRDFIVKSEGDAQRQAYSEYVKETQKVMREHLSFIISKPNTLSSLYALYQRLPSQPYLFTRDADILYYRMVADSTERYFPDSPYVVALRQEINNVDNANDLVNYINTKMEMGGDKYPDLLLPDMYGDKHLLSMMEGNVILLDFWHSGVKAATLNNAELKKLYEKLHDRGFEVFQVSLDTKKAEWVTSVQTQKLPWTTVCDLKGEAGSAVRAYNITRVPTNFLIDRNGTIVARDLYGDKLAQAVGKHL